MKAKYLVPATNFSLFNVGLLISQTDTKSIKLQKKKSRLSTLKKYVPKYTNQHMFCQVNLMLGTYLC